MNPGRGGAGGRRIYGVVVGIVSNITDPEQIGRVKVEFPWMGDTIESHWARVTGQYAGSSRGFMHIPELGDQVMVAFDDGDPTHPYVIGAVYNGQHAVPGPGNTDGKNDHKYFRSRAGHDFEFLDTDGGEKIRLVDSSTNNSMVFDTAADTIKTEAKTGSIRIRAPKGVVKIECVDLKIETTEGRKVDVGTTHSVSVGANRTVGVQSGNLVQSAGNSLSITTSNLEATTQSAVSSSMGSMVMNQGSMEIDVAEVAHTAQGPATRTIGSLSVKATDYTTEGNGPSGALTMMAGMLKIQVDKGVAAFESSGAATVMAGLINVQGSSMTLAGGVDSGGALTPAAASVWLGGLLLLNPKMLTFPAVKMADPIMGLDNHTTLPSVTVPPLPPIPFFPTPFIGPVITGIKPMVLVNFRPSAIANCVALSAHFPPLPWPWPPIPWGAMLKQLVMLLIQIPFSIALNTVKAGLQSMAAEKVPALRSGFMGDFLGTTYAQPPAPGESPFQFGRTAAQYADPNMIASLLSALLPLPVAHASVTFGSSSVTSCGAPMGMAMPMGAASCTEPIPRPNAMATTFSNVLVGISLGDLLGQLAWQKFENKANEMYMKGVAAAARGAGHLVRLSGIESLRNLAQKINDFMGGRQCIQEGHPVDVASGTLFTEAEDVRLYSAQPFGFRRFYNSRTESLPFDGGDMGPGWHHSLDQILIADEIPADEPEATEDERGLRTLTLRDDEGRVIGFEHPLEDGGESFNAPDRLLLTRVDGRTYQIRDLDGRVRVFRFAGGDEGTGATYMPGVRNVARLQAIIEPMGGAGVRPKWDRRGRLQGFTDTAGREVECAHDPGGRITSLRLVSSGGRPCNVFLAGYEYTADGMLRCHIDRNRNKRHYAYDDMGRMVRETDRNGYAFHFHHDDRGRCVRTHGDDNSFWVELDYLPGHTRAIDHGGAATAYALEGGRVVSTVDANGGITARAYTDDGWLTELVKPDTSTWAFTYDDRGRPVEVVAPSGNVTAYTYDDGGQCVGMTDAAGNHWTLLRDADGGLISSTTPGGRTRTIERDDFGRVVRQTEADGEVRERTWSPQGLVASDSAPHGGRTEYGYDLLGRVTAVTEVAADGERRAVTLKRDPEGRVIAIDGAGGHRERFELLPEGQAAKITIGTRTASRRYEGYGRLVEHTDPLGRATRVEHDARHRITAVHLPGGRTWRYERDPVGHTVRSVDPDGVEVRYVRDPAGRVIEEHRPDRVVTRAYGANGRLVKVDWGDDRVTTFEHDAFGRVIEAAEDGARSITRTYDGDGLLVSELQGDEALRWRYDARGRVARRSATWGSRQAYRWGPAGLERMVDGAGSAHRFEHDAWGRRSAWRRPGGTVRRRTWDEASRLVADALEVPGGGAALDRRLTWSEDAHLVAVDITGEGAGRQTFDYDAAGRLTRWSAGADRVSYGYDAADNVIEESGFAARDTAGGRLVGDLEGRQHSYDGLGRQTATDGPDGRRRLWFDSRGRLTRAHLADDTLVHHHYDALGRRAESVAERADGAVVRQVFYWDGADLARRVVYIDGARVRDEDYTFDPEFGFTPLMRAVGGEAQYYLTDQRGAATALTDEAGRVLWRADYDPFGRSRETGPEAGEQPLRLMGQVHDASCDLSWHWFRVYDPRAARFVTPDPVGLDGGPGGYGYPVDPIAWADPLGLVWHDLNGSGMGHHLVPRSIGKNLGIDALSQTNSIAWYPNDPSNTGQLHQDLHRALIDQGVPYHGSKFTGDADDFFTRGSQAYDGFDQQGYLKIPGTDDVLFSNLTPQEALDKIRELHEQGQIPCKS